MATPNNKNGNKLATTSTDSGAPLSLDDLKTKSSSPGISVIGDSGIYSVEHCKNSAGDNIAVEGWVEGTQVITHPEFGETICLVVAITEPTAVANKGVVRIQTAGKVLIPMSDQLEKEKFDERADNEKTIEKCCFVPLKQTKTSKGYKFTPWSVDLLGRMSREDYANMQASKLASQLNGTDGAAQLPAAS